MEITVLFAEDFQYDHFASGMEYAALCVREFLRTNPEFKGPFEDYSNKVFNARIIPQLGRHLVVRVDYWKVEKSKLKAILDYPESKRRLKNK